jgi:hypothetical protein
MAYTEAHLAALEQALARGESRVRFEDKMVEYRSVEEFEQARDSGLWPGAPRQIRVTTNKGL